MHLFDNFEDITDDQMDGDFEPGVVYRVEEETYLQEIAAMIPQTRELLEQVGNERRWLLEPINLVAIQTCSGLHDGNAEHPPHQVVYILAGEPGRSAPSEVILSLN